ncbi:MAG: tripartite tricarboxylate transporter substrate binding protein [Alphaproteobacteria bacterium]|nr:tripartite tricarboxylate transporter substrate binding protein [Alphaproteobacteria bacterium]
MSISLTPIRPVRMRSERRPTRRRVLSLPLAAATLAVAGGSAAQQAWPRRPVTFVVPYGPGASNDTFTRALAEILSKRFGQPFVVENRAGAGGFTGSNAVAQAAPDGYTFLEAPNSIVGFKPLMKVNLDPLTSLTPVALLARSPIAMVVPSGLPVKTVREFIDYAKARPDQLFYGHAGVGTTQQQHAEMFKRVTGLKIKNVNYKSSADAQADLVAGRLQLMFITIASTVGQIQSGQLRLLAYTDKNYPPGSLPAPTLAELGVPDMEKAQSWWAIFAPPRLPPEILKAANAAINEAIMDPSFTALLARSGASPAPASPDELISVIKQEVADIAELMKTITIE